jgi:4-hydroxybenzoate polyprenyltransferase
MVFVSMFFILLFVIDPLLGAESFEMGLSEWEFLLLLSATLFITAGGYLINDFFDMDADRINKPGKNLVGGKWSVATVQVLYWVFTLLGVGLGVLLSWVIGKLTYSLVFVFAAGLLWFYSERYKCMPIIGNLVVAFLSALSFGLVWLFYFFALSRDAIAFTDVQSNFELVNVFILIYMGFAFVTSLLREIVKDIEDSSGDERYGCNTFVVAFGQTKAKVLAAFIAFLGLVATIFTQLFFFDIKFMMMLGYFVLIDLGFLLSVIWIIKGNKKSDFKRISTFSKLLMFVGVFSMTLVYLEILIGSIG